MWTSSGIYYFSIDTMRIMFYLFSQQGCVLAIYQCDQHDLGSYWLTKLAHPPPPQVDLFKRLLYFSRPFESLNMRRVSNLHHYVVLSWWKFSRPGYQIFFFTKLQKLIKQIIVLLHLANELISNAWTSNWKNKASFYAFRHRTMFK